MTIPAYFLRVEPSARLGPVWYVRWRHEHTDGSRKLVERALKVDGKSCPAWMVQDGERWVPRKGRAHAGHLTENAAIVAADAFVAEVDAELTARELAGVPAAARATFRHAWRGYREYLLEEQVTPNTLATYDGAFAEPGTPHRRGKGVSVGFVMTTLGDVPLKRITTERIDALLKVYADENIGTPDAPRYRSARTVNKLRQGLHAVLEWATIPRNGMGLTRNPVTHARVRTERKDHSKKDWFDIEEAEAVARVLEQGLHRTVRTFPPKVGIGPRRPERFTDDEIAARRWEDQRDADAVRLTAITGLRLHELTPLQIQQVRFDALKILVSRSVSDGIEQERDKGDNPGEVPMPDHAIVILHRVLARPHFLGPSDYVFINRDGGRLSGSALAKRFKRALAISGLAHQHRSWHSLRHGYATELVRGGADRVTVKNAMRHASVETTERYEHARSASEQAARFTDIFNRATSPTPPLDPRGSADGASTVNAPPG